MAQLQQSKQADRRAPISSCESRYSTRARAHFTRCGLAHLFFLCERIFIENLVLLQLCVELGLRLAAECRSEQSRVEENQPLTRSPLLSASLLLFHSLASFLRTWRESEPTRPPARAQSGGGADRQGAAVAESQPRAKPLRLSCAHTLSFPPRQLTFCAHHSSSVVACLLSSSTAAAAARSRGGRRPNGAAQLLLAMALGVRRRVRERGTSECKEKERGGRELERRGGVDRAEERQRRERKKSCWKIADQTCRPN